MHFQALPGFRDFPPDDLAFRSHILAGWRRVAARYGFVEYDGPPLEPLELYTAKSGPEIVGQLFEFTDKGGRAVALRPEMTPTFARMVAAHSSAMRKPIRWFAIPQLFRYEKQQKGRLREHFQLNCDLVGEAGPLADAEVIAMSIDMCRELGLTADDFKVRLSDRATLDTLFTKIGVSEHAMPLVFTAIDRMEKIGREATSAELRDAGLNDEQIAHILAVADVRSLDQLTIVAGQLGVSLTDSTLVQAMSAIDTMGLGDFLELDLSIVRGLAYYTGIVFELFDRKGKMRAICGGGRYDNLTESLAGVSLPAVGFGMGDVVLGELLKDRGLKPETPASIDVFVASVTAEDEPFVIQMSHTLRDAGLRVEYALTHGNLGKQLKLADARNARLAVVIGPDDRAQGMVQVKDLSNKQQHAVSPQDLAARCTELLSTTG